MKETTATNQVVIVVTEHPVLGVLLTPYIADQSADGTIQLIEQAFHASPETVALMSATEQKAIDIASHYTEKYLMGVYSHEKTTPRFLRKLSEETERLKRTIRPFIEKKLLEMIELISTCDLPLYQRQGTSKQLYTHNTYHVNKQKVDVQFAFQISEACFSYQLKCFYNQKLMPLAELKPVTVLTSSPATLLLGMELFTFHHIESSRILPFTKKPRISVDAALTEKYIDIIIIPIAQYHDISIEGLSVIEEKRSCEALLYVEDTICKDTLLRLDFRYGELNFTPAATDEMKKFLTREEVDGKPAIRYFERDIPAEKRAIHLLHETGLLRVSDSHFKLMPTATEKNVTAWITRHREMLRQEFILTSSAQEKPYYLDEIHVEQSYEDGPDWFELHITVVIGDLRIPFSRFRKHILEDDREYTLPDGRIVLLPEEWFSKYASLLEMGEESGKSIRLKHSFVGIVQSLLDSGGLKELPVTLPLQELPAPIGLKAQLRPYQLKGFSWMTRLYEQGLGGCLADDMGLGKTLQTLSTLQSIYGKQLPEETVTLDLPVSATETFDEKGQLDLFGGLSAEGTLPGNGKQAGGLPASRKPASLIVVPTSLLHNWRQETRRFTTLSMTEYNGSIPYQAEYLKKHFDSFHLVFTTYGMMRNNIAQLSQYTFEYVILDESQNIKNSDSLTFRSAMQLRSNHRLTLTGTPIENSLKDLWAQFHFLQPDLLSDENTFNKHFINAIKQGDQRMEARLRQLIAPFILRRSKKEVAPELPSLTEEVIYCDMVADQDEIYQQEKNSLRNTLMQIHANNEQHQPLTVLNGILRLRQLACHPKMLFNDFTGESGKLQQIIDTFETLRSEGHKVLIFSSFVKHLELIAAEFIKRDWSYTLLTGASTNRPEEIDRFAHNENIQAFLISLKAGGVGLNLTQADYVFIVDPWWNPAAEAQAIARAHRIGQDKQVIAYRFITQGSIEEKIILLQQGKRKLAETFITDSEAMPSLTDNEWVDLLQ